MLGAHARRRGIVSEITSERHPADRQVDEKIQRQLVLSTMKPPTAGPTIEAAANTAPISPC